VQAGPAGVVMSYENTSPNKNQNRSQACAEAKSHLFFLEKYSIWVYN